SDFDLRKIKDAEKEVNEAYQQNILDTLERTKTSFIRLKLAYCVILTNKQLIRILKHSPQLQYLDISYCPLITADIFKTLAAYSTLEKIKANGLQFKKVYIKQPWFSTSAWQGLKHLELNECTSLEEIYIEAPNLICLKLKEAKKLNWKKFQKK